ncbi:MAG: hypothetical protein P1V97_06095 [Planctomycetota bacterium]|nr:hypothetical protein [Planctomycetota bacterium]
MLTEWLYENPTFVYLIWLLGHAVACRLMVLGDRNYQSQSQLGIEADHRMGCRGFGDFLRMTACDSLIMGGLVAIGAYFCQEYSFAVLSGAIVLPYAVNIVEHFDNVALYGVLAKHPQRDEPGLTLTKAECYEVSAKKCVGYAVFLFILFGATSNPLLLGGGIGILAWGGLRKLESAYPEDAV